MGQAARRWREQLETWAIPQELLDQAVEDPWAMGGGGDGDRVARALADPSPALLAALDALPEAGTVLDVGCGAGAAGVPVAARGRASGLVAVDASPRALEALVAAAAKHAPDTRVRTIVGRWPDVAREDAVSPVDVVTCHNVVYDVQDVGPFLEALTEHARRRVVLELTASHPLHWTGPHWQAVHGLDRPDGPIWHDLVEVLAEQGVTPQVAIQERVSPEPDGLVDILRRHLCLAPGDEDRVRSSLADHPRPDTRQTVCLHWPGASA